MFNVKLQAGDVFVVQTSSKIAGLINNVSGFNSPDGKSTYNHAGIILANNGLTFEALRELNYSELENYCGQRIMIARPDTARINQLRAIDLLMDEHKGQTYPWWRIPLHLYPPLARLISYKGKWVVCSELVAKYLYASGARHENFTGTTPDQLAEEWVNWKNFDVIFEGTLALKLAAA